MGVDAGVQPKGFHPLIGAVIGWSRHDRTCGTRLSCIFGAHHAHAPAL